MVGPESLRPHFLDSSALVKLVINEPDSEILREYFRSHAWFVTSPLCIGEALNVVKRKWNRHELTDEQYRAVSWELLFPYRKGSKIQLKADYLADPEVFFGAFEISARYGVDMVDALQLYMLSRGSMATYCSAVHISADRQLTLAARHERLLAWDCVHESSPPQH